MGRGRSPPGQAATCNESPRKVGDLEYKGGIQPLETVLRVEFRSLRKRLPERLCLAANALELVA